eukprot:6139877-Prymnesium_polylepis.1
MPPTYRSSGARAGGSGRPSRGASLLVRLDREPDVEDEASDRAHDRVEEGHRHRVHQQVGHRIEEDAADEALAEAAGEDAHELARRVLRPAAPRHAPGVHASSAERARGLGGGPTSRAATRGLHTRLRIGAGSSGRASAHATEDGLQAEEEQHVDGAEKRLCDDRLERGGAEAGREAVEQTRREAGRAQPAGERLEARVHRARPPVEGERGGEQRREHRAEEPQLVDPHDGLVLPRRDATRRRRCDVSAR